MTSCMPTTACCIRSSGGRYADMLYPLKNAEAYNRNFRSLILCGPGSAFAAEYGLDAALLDRVDWKKLDGMDAPELKELARSRP